MMISNIRTRTIQALGNIEGFKHDVRMLDDALGQAPMWRPGAGLRKQCEEVLIALYLAQCRQCLVIQRFCLVVPAPFSVYVGKLRRVAQVHPEIGRHPGVLQRVAQQLLCLFVPSRCCIDTAEVALEIRINI